MRTRTVYTFYYIYIYIEEEKALSDIYVLIGDLIHFSRYLQKKIIDMR